MTRFPWKKAATIAAVGPLIAILKDKNETVCSNALYALCSITGQDFGLDAAKWQEWWKAKQ